MITETANKNCLSCSRLIKGRTDKKFCDDLCRNNYNNLRKSNDNNYIRNVNNALRKNRRILASLLEGNDDGKTTVQREQLLAQGFDSKYITHLYTTQTGKVYHFCYDCGYLPLTEDVYLLVKRNPGYAGAKEKG